MLRRLSVLLAMAVMLAIMLALGAGSALAAPFGPNPFPEGCVGSAAAPIAISTLKERAG